MRSPTTLRRGTIMSGSAAPHVLFFCCALFSAFLHLFKCNLVVLHCTQRWPSFCSPALNAALSAFSCSAREVAPPFLSLAQQLDRALYCISACPSRVATYSLVLDREVVRVSHISVREHVILVPPHARLHCFFPRPCGGVPVVCPPRGVWG